MYRFLSFLLLFLIVSIAYFFQNNSNLIEKKNELSLIIPLYSYPTLWNSSMHNNLNYLNNKFKKTIVIINPNNGPGKYRNPDYVNGIKYLNNNNIKVLGYIYTKYTKRKLFKVYHDLELYKDNYGDLNLKGIFFDEISLSSKEDLDYLTKIIKYAHDLGFSFIAINPGIKLNQEFIDLELFDLVISFEDSFENYNIKDIKVKESKKTKHALLIYNLKEKISFDKIKNQGFDYFYLTEDSLPNPWDTLYKIES